MKKRFVALLLIFPIAFTFLSGAKALARSYTTTFPATENPVSESGVWIGPAASWTVVSTSTGFAHGTQTHNAPEEYYADSYAMLSGFGNDQQVDMVVTIKAVAGEVEGLLRFSKSGNNTYGYECLFGPGGGMQLVSWDGPVGTFHSLAFGGLSGLSTGDTVRAKIVGNHITMSLIRGGVEKVGLDFIDTENNHPTGQPGMGFFASTGVSNTSFGISQYSATDGNNEPFTPKDLKIINITR